MFAIATRSKPVSRFFVRDLEPAAQTPDPIAAGRAQLMAGILERNPSASLEFLGRFSEPALKDYLEHLELISEPRQGGRGWVRRGGTPAIVTRVVRV